MTALMDLTLQGASLEGASSGFVAARCVGGCCRIGQ